MTLPDERYRAVLWAERFLKDLAYNHTEYPRVPKKVRNEAHRILHHFPSQFDMDIASRTSPNVFTPKIEDLHRFILKGKDNE